MSLDPLTCESAVAGSASGCRGITAAHLGGVRKSRLVIEPCQVVIAGCLVAEEAQYLCDEQIWR